PGMMRGYGPGMGPGGPGMERGPGMGPGWQGPRGEGPGPRGPGGPGGRGFGLADPAQIEQLKGELAITPAQEAAWTKYAKTMQDAATSMQTVRQSMDPATIAKMTPQDRYAFMTTMRGERQKQFEAVNSATDELFKTLDDGQKAKALEVLPGLGFGPGRMRAAGPGGHFHRW
ncbi:MAG TPA: Spy/CpxP family protein refolding chaperone, partial [Pseudolabrys sp.]|nr:Spy/CpxP family protein refolding chaperone [Pseudolabrys sp.]